MSATLELATNPTQPSREECLKMYRWMLLSRKLDDVEVLLKRQNKIYFQISGAGHEATCAAAALHLKPSYDWFFPYYRDRALCLGLGVTAKEMLLQSVGAADDPASGGRQMPSHWGHKPLNLVSQSSPTGTQFLQAVGCGHAMLIWHALAQKGVVAGRYYKDEVVYVSAGEGTTSQGEFFESLNIACQLKLPIIFHIEDNGYAISTPVEEQTAGGSISKLVLGFPELLRLEFDGCDPDESYSQWQQAVSYARARKGPVLVHSHVVRPYSHSLSDDESHYRSPDELKKQAERDPIVRYRQTLMNQYQITTRELEAIEKQIEADVEQGREQALKAQPPKASTASLYVYSPDIDSTDRQEFSGKPKTAGEEKTMVDLINACMRDEMRHDGRIVIFGEDVADVSREEVINEVKGKGGVFKVTQGLQREFGSRRVFNSPLAEAGIIGRAIGMALRGLRPVVEIQFFDYIWPAMQQIRNELAVMRWRSHNTWKCPVVIRCAYGGYLKGGAIYHSQTGESIFAHTPGLRVVLPSNALDANGLLRTAMRSDDPVLFLEHKHLYRQTYNRAPYPGSEFMVPFGMAKRVRNGQHLTIITYGALVKRSLDAAEEVASHGIDVEVLDLRTIAPYDWESIAISVKKTNRALVVYEDGLSWGSGSEIAARISEDLFEYLDAPVQRVASMDTFVGYHPDLEDVILPQTANIVQTIQKTMRY